MADLDGRVSIDDPGTMRVGPLGSTVHVLRADAGTVAALAAIDWNRWFSRVRLDPACGLITLMSPSRLHDELAEIFDDIVDAAASAAAGASKSFGTTRLRKPDDPPGTGLEADCAFYLDERARAYIAALAEGEAAAETYFLNTPPDLVVEVEITHGDDGRIERYGAIGVRELWRLHGRKGTRTLRADFLALGRGAPPRALAASEVLAGPDARGRLRGHRESAAQRHPRRAQRRGRPHRTPPPARQRARSRRRDAVRCRYRVTTTIPPAPARPSSGSRCLSSERSHAACVPGPSTRTTRSSRTTSDPQSPNARKPLPL